MDDLSQGDICRVCRCEEQFDRPLFYPCICTGSIKFIHQDCLQQWMRFSRKKYCELCGHRFSFTPIYSADMPRVLPLRDVAGGLLTSIAKTTKHWLHNTFVALTWFGIVPLTSFRTYHIIFSGSSFDTIFSLPVDVFSSTENIAWDHFRGSFVVTCTLLSSVGLVWLRGQILHGGGPDWLERDEIIRQAAAQEHVELNDNNNNENNNNENEAPINVPIDNAEPPPADAEAEAGNRALNEDPANLPNGNEEANWNPMERNRAAEQLTWKRLLGFDGRMAFLQYVFWVMLLNTIFIFTFAFSPYCIGNFVINWLGLVRPDEKQPIHFHGLITTLFGYCNIGLVLVVLYYFARLFRMSKIRWLLRLCYIVVKVALLSFVEIGCLPLVCGWWLDICSLPLFDATIKDRKASFHEALGSSLLLHWMFGMMYKYYFVTFIFLLKEVLRPGVLWFLRSLNDPVLIPTQEMIHHSILHHIRRLIASIIIFGSAVLFILWLPIQILTSAWSSFLPYTLSEDSKVNELSLQLLFLLIIIPGLFEQSQARVWLKDLLRVWCQTVARFLGIKSYLLGNEATENVNGGPAEPERVQQDHNQGLAAAHQFILQREAPFRFQPYDRPSFYPFRVFGLMVLMCISLVVFSLVTLTVPVWIGRQVMAVWSVANHIASHQVSTNPEDTPRPHELCTAIIGTYLCWIISGGIAIVVNLHSQGRAAVIIKIKHWLQIGASYALAVIIFVLMFGVIPLLSGLYLELVLLIPLRVPISQTPIHYLRQDWALGVLYMKIGCAIILMGPNSRLKRVIKRMYRHGWRDMDLKFLIREVATPSVRRFGLALAVPYVAAHSIVPIFFEDPTIRHMVCREIHPFYLGVSTFIEIICIQIKQFKKLYVAIRNDKYLLGQRLVNYEHRKKKPETLENPAQSTLSPSTSTMDPSTSTESSASADHVTPSPGTSLKNQETC